MDDFEDYAASALWYHAMKIGDICTRGRFDQGVQNRTLLGVFDMLNGVDVSGLRCLDIGTVDGITAFALKLRGAVYVAATDRVKRDNFLRARAALDLEIDYFPGLEFSTMLDHFRGQRFDVVICAGVIYHMLNPFSAFQVCRLLTRPGGLAVFESACDAEQPAPVMSLNSESAKINEIYTYWAPSPSSMEGMMRLAGFDVLDRRTQRALKRHAVIGRAVQPDAISARSDLLIAMQKAGYVDSTFTPSMWDQGARDHHLSYRPGSSEDQLTPGREASIEFSLHVTPSEYERLRVIGGQHPKTRL
jgi:2-polyprenyl-3-methyl-5-hydroxy-6-metoxy-1,4-benzoquinol methylase